MDRCDPYRSTIHRPLTVSLIDAAVADATAWLDRNPAGRLVVSVARHHDLGERLRSPLLVAPAVRGRTVWAAAGDWTERCAVVDSPNLYGCAETVPTDGAHVVVDRRAGAPRWGARLAAAAQTGSALAQIADVAVPFGAGEAPWLVVTTPRHPAGVARVLCDDGIAAQPLGGGHPGLPGAVRIEVDPSDPSPRWVAACVASFQRAMTQGAITRRSA